MEYQIQGMITRGVVQFFPRSPLIYFSCREKDLAEHQIQRMKPGGRSVKEPSSIARKCVQNLRTMNCLCYEILMYFPFLLYVGRILYVQMKDVI